MATTTPSDVSELQALVIDSNATSRGILVSQLRDYGITKVAQCARLQDARNRLEHTRFDYVLCEQSFGASQSGGQTLLDDLRRAQLLPFSTVFFMVTGEASYAAVAEAAESALDGYLLKPFTPSALFERLSLARLRKVHLKPIFDAIEQEDFTSAVALCLQRFESRQPYWLYAARIGSELLLRMGRHDEARTLFEAVIAVKALPWAKLGIARTQIESGQATKAVGTLQALVDEDASFADAYDVLGRAQVELGHTAEAINTYRTASQLTPDSVVRLQKLGMMAHYTGDRVTAAKVLSRAAMLGWESKLFDPLSQVLLAFSHCAENDRKGLERCQADLGRIIERHGNSIRLHRLREIVRALQLLQQRQLPLASQLVRDMAADIKNSDFDFEAACNLATLLSVFAARSIQLPESEGWIQTLGLRYANTRGLSELMAQACKDHPGYADIMRSSLQHINKIAEAAMARSLAGDPLGAVRQLIQSGSETLNVKLTDLAQQVLLRNAKQLDAADELKAQLLQLKTSCGSAPARATLGQDHGRTPGGVVIRTRSATVALPEAAPAKPAMPESADTLSVLQLRP